MASLSNWMVTQGVTQSAAAWGLKGLTITSESCRTGELTFVADGAAIDSAPVFPDKSMLVVTSPAGVPTFVGQVRKIPRKGSAAAESLAYVVTDPWYDIERTTFQQQWMTTDLAGTAGATMTTTRTRIIMAQALDGVKIDLVSCLREVLIYMLYAVQGLPFPATVDVNHLPPLPDPAAGTPPTFQIGRMPASIGVPYFEEKDMKCGELIRRLLKSLPDVVQSFDFTTTPPTINFDHRSAMPTRVISVLGGLVTSEFSPTALAELQVPVVICKYEQTITNDGKTTDLLSVDKWPRDGRDNDPAAFVQTVDLVGGNAVYQHQDVVVKNLPVATAGTATLPWVKAHIPWLFGTATNLSLYDAANISVAAWPPDGGLVIDIDPQDPAANPDTAPTGFTLAALNAELVQGDVSPWMVEEGVFAAMLIIPVRLLYSGSVATTAALFQNDPANPNTRTEYIRVRCTNAETQTYKQLTSLQPTEAVPVGFARMLYNTLSVLHQQGDIEITEEECSNLLPMGCVFNTSDGLPEWQAMNALVLKRVQDLDNGKTKISFGPSVYLGLEDLVELARANRGRVVSFKLDQRTSGEAGGGNAVIGPLHPPHTSTFSAPGGGGGDAAPFAPGDKSSGAIMKVGISPGLVNGAQPDGLTDGAITVAAGAGTVYVQFDFTYDAYNTVTKTGNTFHSTNGDVPASVLTPGGTGGGSGTFYWPICSFTGVLTAGKATTSPRRLVNGSFSFGVCGGAFLLPS